MESNFFLVVEILSYMTEPKEARTTIPQYSVTNQCLLLARTYINQILRFVETKEFAVSDVVFYLLLFFHCCYSLNNSNSYSIHASYPFDWCMNGLRFLYKMKKISHATTYTLLLLLRPLLLLHDNKNANRADE